MFERPTGFMTSRYALPHPSFPGYVIYPPSSLQAIIYSLTSVPAERQKIIGLVKGKIPGDESCLYVLPSSPLIPFTSPFRPARSKDLAIPARRHKFTLIGTPQEKTFVDPSDVDPKNLPDVMDDFDVSCTSPSGPFLSSFFLSLRVANMLNCWSADKGEGFKPADDPRNQRLVKHRIETCQIDVSAHLPRIVAFAHGCGVDHERT